MRVSASTLVRHAAEATKPDGERLEEYSEAHAPELRAQILSPAPVYPEMETRALTWLLSRLPEHLGTSDPVTAALLAHESPHDLAQRLIAGTKLADPEQRRALLDGGAAAIAAPDDPLIVYARDLWEPRAREVREDYEANVAAVLTMNAGLIDRARYAASGGTASPDATFTPRLSYGTVRGYTHDGTAKPALTTIGEAFEENTGRDPFRLPQTWLDARASLDPATPLDLVLTADIVGGNSGSPLIGRDGRLVGLIFTGNDAAEAGTYGYDDTEARSIAVDAAAIRLALGRIYHADRLLKEMEGAGG